MPGKTHTETPPRSERLSAEYESCLASFETRAESMSNTEKAKELMVLARLSSAISNASSAAHRERAAAARAETAAARARVANAHAEKMLRIALREPTDEGAVIEPNESAHSDSSPEHLELLRTCIAARFGELASGLDDQGLLGDVIALGDAGAGAELGHTSQPQAVAA